MPHAKRLAILTGGTSSEHDIALQSAAEIKHALAARYPVSVFIFPEQQADFLTQRENFDVALPVFHGRGGEDGTIQGFLQTLGIPFIFSGVAAHAIALNKAFTKDIVARAGLRTAAYRQYVRQDEQQIRYQGKCVIKPLDGGSSIGVSIAHNQGEFEQGLRDAFAVSESVLIEDYLAGDEYTVAVIEDRQELVALPVVAIRPKNAFFNLESKYNPDLVEEICPAPIPPVLAKQLQEAALQIHRLIGARHLTRSDFIVDHDGEVWFLEINTIPGQTLNSLVPKAIRASGRKMDEVMAGWIESVAVN